MWFVNFCQWLQNTALSSWLRDHPYPYPAFLTIHVLTIGFCGAVIALGNFRLLGLAFPGVPVSRIFNQFRPWKWIGFAVILVTGFFLTLSDPLEYHNNIMYWLSLVVLVLVGVNALVFHRGIYRSVAEWDESPVTPVNARRFAVLSLVGWIALVFISRAIAFF